MLEPHRQTKMNEDGPSECVEALLTAFAQRTLGSITVCAILPRGSFAIMSATKTCKELPGVRKDQRR